MPKIDFPSSPVNGQLYTNPATGVVYQYSSAYSSWQILGNTPYFDVAFAKANTANITADAAFNQANLAYAQANTGGGGGSGNGILAFAQANLAFAKANSANITADAAFNRTNLAFAKANTANITADLAFNQANLAYAQANTVGGGSYFQGNNGDVGSASGLGDIFRVHTNILNANVTIYSGNNALAAGPITINTGRTLTIQTNARVAIV